MIGPINPMPAQLLVAHSNDALMLCLLDEYKIRRGTDYTFLYVSSKEVTDDILRIVAPGRPQLIFLDYDDKYLDLKDLPRKIKATNAQAIVILIAAVAVNSLTDVSVDGVVCLNMARSNNPNLAAFSLPSSIAWAFKQGHPREDLVAMTKSVRK